MVDLKKKSNEEIDWRARVFDSLSFPTLILLPNKTIISANQIFLKRNCVDMNEIAHKTCHEIFFNTKKACSEDICPFSKVLKDKAGHSILRRKRNKNGEDQWEDRVFSPILDDDGDVKYVMESIRDVTRIRTLEKALEETKEFLVKVIQSSPSAIISADRSGNLLLMNQAAEDLFGYSNKELSKISVASIYPPGEAKEIMKVMRDEGYGGKGKLPSRKGTIINKDHDKIPVEMAAAIIYEGDKEVASMGIYNDQREKLAVERKLKEAHKQLAQTEKMASMGQLAAGVAHEINNPMTGILFNVSMALETLSPDDRNREKLESVIEDIHRCEDIVKNLLMYSRQTNPSKVILQIEAIVEQGLNLIRDQRLFGNVRINKDLSSEMIMIHADRNQITQVLINLVINACDAMEGKGKLTLRTYRDKPNKKACLEVSDTGCGISGNDLQKIFDPFFSTKERGKGTGLGLSTSYGIIKENGGNISVKDTSSAGTTFLVELPLYVPAEGRITPSE